jgi:hypothetical protein
MNAAVELDYFGGYAPIQAWGKIDNQAFYFRARWDEWRFEIGKPGVSVPTLENNGLLFVREGEFLPDDFHEETAATIVSCFREFFIEVHNPQAAHLLSNLDQKLKAAMKLET